MSMNSHGAGSDHGNTPAAWTTVITMIVGAIISGVALIAAKPWIFWVGVGIIVAGVVIGKVMGLLGFGKPRLPAGGH